MKFSIGEVVRIIDNITDHGFEIGEEVVVDNLGADGSVITAHAYNDSSDYWFIEEEEIEKI